MPADGRLTLTEAVRTSPRFSRLPWCWSPRRRSPRTGRRPPGRRSTYTVEGAFDQTNLLETLRRLLLNGTLPNPLRVFVAKDSPTARRLLVEIVREDPTLQVVGEGEEIGSRRWRSSPSGYTRPWSIIDIQMPNLDGLQATQRIMTEVPTPVVVVSTLVASATSRRPWPRCAPERSPCCRSWSAPVPDFERESRHLRDTLKAMAVVKVVRHSQPRVPTTPLAPSPRWAPTRPTVVAIATSTGGPAALHRHLLGAGELVPLPILVVQHIALGSPQGMAEWLGLRHEADREGRQ